MKKQVLALVFAAAALGAQAQMDDFALLEQHKHQKHIEQADFIRSLLLSQPDWASNPKLGAEFLSQLRSLHGLATSSNKDFAVHIQELISQAVGNCKIAGANPAKLAEKLEKYLLPAKALEEKMLAEPSEFWAAYADNFADLVYLDILQELLTAKSLDIPMDKFSVLAAPASLCKQGEPYKLEIGLGAFNSTIPYSLYINGKLQQESARGLSGYQFVPEKVGKQKLEVEIRILNPLTGETVSAKKSLILEVQK